ncbi:MAG TPA: DUF421 domain-containing protein [Tessaracoccus flavescens]|uniref:DUF421 domain-containing protein n=1 Tax=Tessaracoccus flavescens TaxID=399497 RepID=A0A921JRM9_9ACTN|nr:DUF421 domain-containing protein [Tessaracoccus flavescens]
MDFWAALWQEIGITLPHAVGVVVSSAVLYLAFTVVLRVWGQRLFANRSGSGLAVVLVLGAIIGRSMLGPSATLLGGLLCLATLLTLESAFGQGRRAGLFGHRRAVVVYVDGDFNRRALQRFHLDERVIWGRLRQAGVTSLDHVAALILETDGNLSVLRAGADVDPRLLTNVRGADRLLNS